TRNTLDYSWDVTVAKNNRAPTADDLVATVNEDESVAITLSGSDPDEDVLTFSVVDSPAHGDFAGGIYTPDADYFGPDQFTYIANDGDLDSDPASVTITVTAVNDAPVIDLSTATITFTQNTTTTVDFASYVSDVDSGGLILTAEGNLDITVSIEGLSVLFGTVDSEFTGSEEVTFTVTDGQYPVSDAITITVNGLADVPATPTNLALTLAGSDAIDLSWTDSSINEDVFRIYRGTASGNLTLLVEVAANSTSYSDIGLAPHTEYFYNISAYNTYGESGMSGEQSESTPNTAPVIDLEGLTVVFAEDGSTIVDLATFINDDDGDTLILTATNSENIFAEIDVFNVTFTATENWNGSEELTFTVNDQQGRAVASDVTTVVVDPVNDAPTIDLASLSVSFTQGTTIDVDFAEYVEDIDLDVLTLSASGNDHITTEINELVVTFGTANPEFTGFENIVFTVFDGEFEDQETTTVTVNALASVPAPPSDLALTVLGADEISLLWVDNSINEDGFRIYRSLEDDNYSLLAEVSANETSYTDSGLTQNTTYYYYVTAYNSYGENDPQEAQSATTLNPVPTITSIEDVPSDEGGFVTVNFNRSVMDTGDGIDESYSIEIFTDESWTEVGNEPAVGDDTYSVIVMLPETGTISEPISFQFRVMAVMDEGSYLSEEMSGYAIDNLAPAVDLLTAVSTQQGVVLEWSAVIVPDLQHFVITRREFGGDMVEIGTSMTVSYLDADPEATPGEQYFYSVYGVDIHANVGDPAEEAQVSFPQPTLLSNFTAEATGAGVEIAWELSGIDQGVSFIVKRSDAGADNYVVIDTPVVQLSELVFTVSDSSVQPAESYSYKIDFENDTGSWLLFETGVVQMPEMSYALHQNSPNPFNPLTTISYDLNKASAVRLTVYDIAGRAVRHLVDSPGESAGRHQVKWFGCDDSGHQVTSGVYFYVIQAGEFKQSKRMLLLK
ncbi:MAG: tandem-95 repeat protein, partial [bacterium]|nr:tandem-95 repeat protein [bacterium]